MINNTSTIQQSNDNSILQNIVQPQQQTNLLMQQQQVNSNETNIDSILMQILMQNEYKRQQMQLLNVAVQLQQLNNVTPQSSINFLSSPLPHTPTSDVK